MVITFCTASGCNFDSGGHGRYQGGLGHIFFISNTFSVFSSNVQKQSDLDEEMASLASAVPDPANQVSFRSTIRSFWPDVALTISVCPFLSVVPCLGNTTSNFEIVSSVGAVVDSMHGPFSPQGQTR